MCTGSDFGNSKQKSEIGFLGFLRFSDLSDCEEKNYLFHSRAMTAIDIVGELVGRAGRTKHHKLDSHSSAEKSRSHGNSEQIADEQPAKSAESAAADARSRFGDDVAATRCCCDALRRISIPNDNAQPGSSDSDDDNNPTIDAHVT